MCYLGATLTQVFTCTRGADVSLRDVTIARDGKRGLQSAGDVTRRKRAEDFGGFWKSQFVRVKVRYRTRRVDFRLLAEALGRCRTRWGGCRWKSQDRKILPLSPYVEKPLNSKVIESFVPELRSRKCFSCFEIPMFYVYIYIWALYVRFTHSHIMAMVQDLIMEDLNGISTVLIIKGNRQSILLR